MRTFVHVTCVLLLCCSTSKKKLGCNAQLIVDEFGEKLLEELDYLQEARNIQVILSYCTSMSCGPAHDIQVILHYHTSLSYRLMCDSCWLVMLAQHFKGRRSKGLLKTLPTR